MPRKVFYSFNYEEDRDRVSQVRNMGVVEGSPIASDNDWEEIKRGGKPAIKKWIDDQMHGTSCCVLLIGAATAHREWVEYELDRAWRDGKGIVGVYIYELLNLKKEKGSKGANPLDFVKTPNGTKLSSIVSTYDPPRFDSKEVYAYIKEHLPAWIEEAISIRKAY